MVRRPPRSTLFPYRRSSDLQGLERPSIDKEWPELRVQAYLRRDKLALYLDLAGRSLHQRGYRAEGAKAPLKENLAAAIVLRAGWPQLAATGAPLDRKSVV